MIKLFLLLLTLCSIHSAPVEQPEVKGNTPVIKEQVVTPVVKPTIDTKEHSKVNKGSPVQPQPAKEKPAVRPPEPTQEKVTVTVIPNNLVTLVNAHRVSQGLTAYSIDPSLNKSAYVKAEHMCNNHYWAHVGGGLTTWFEPLKNEGIQGRMGENLAKDYSTSQGVVDGWLASPAHRANVESPVFIRVGAIAVKCKLLDKETTLYVQQYSD